MEKTVKRLADLEAFVESHKENKYTNGFVYHHFLSLNKNATLTATSLISSTGNGDLKLTSLKTSILRVDDQMKLFRKNINGSWNSLVNYLNQEFRFPETKLFHDVDTVLPKLPLILSPLKTRIDRDCHTCVTKKHTNAQLLKVNKKLKLERTLERKEKFSIKENYQVKRVNQMLQRKSCRISRYQMKTQKLNEKVNSLTKSLKKAHLKSLKLSRAKKTSDRKIISLEHEIQCSKHKLEDIESKMIEKDAIIENLIERIQEFENSQISTKDNKKQFNSCVRMVIYRCLESNVPVEAIPKVILACASLIPNVEIMPQDLPNPSTIAQMCREMGVIAEVQVAEAIMKARVVTLAFDATTVKGCHINEVHFGTKDQILTASIRELPGGRADDYVQHIMETIEDISLTYSTLLKCDSVDIKKQICGKIMSTLTDRACVNHAAIVKLNLILEKELLELHCHIHPLDGIANEVKKELIKSNSEIPSGNFGSDCRAANLLYSVSKLRYKAKGDPSGFKSFLKENGLKSSTFPRYVGNRLHILFCSAGIVLRYRHLLVQYLDKYCNNVSSLRTAVLQDLRNDTLMLHVQALGLWGKLLTGPWMALFYTDESQRNHLDMVVYLKSATNFIRRVMAEPEFILFTTEDAFGRPLIVDEILAALRIIEGDMILKLSTVIKTVATATLTVLSRQLSRYLDGELSSPSEEMKDIASSASVHNIWAERTLGIIDSLARKAPNATISFLDAKAKIKMNRTMDWLSSKGCGEKNELIKFSISRGAVSRKMEKERSLKAQEIIQLRLKERGQKRDMGQRNKLSKEIKKLLIDPGFTADLLISNPVFSSVADYAKTKVMDLLSDNPHVTEGVKIHHLWNVEGHDVLFHGKIILKCKPSPAKQFFFRIAYWKDHEDEDDAEDSKMSLDSLLADVVLGDLVFC